MGIISEIGSGVTLLKKGDRVVLPFNVADGRCLNCEEGNTAFCTGVNPGYVNFGAFVPCWVANLVHIARFYAHCGGAAPPVLCKPWAARQSTEANVCSYSQT